jgi:Cys-tRNA(Pro)/Cys-tRNA(Cys) deacylase
LVAELTAAMAKQQKTGGTPATTALTGAAVAFTVHDYAHDPRSASYGEEAATAMGIAPARVFKTLLADVDGTLTVAVVPVSGQLDLKALARAVGGRKAAMADPETAAPGDLVRLTAAVTAPVGRP